MPFDLSLRHSTISPEAQLANYIGPRALVPTNLASISDAEIGDASFDVASINLAF